jgi:ribosome-binding factor A
MSNFRKEKIEDRIKELSAIFIEKGSNMSSLITVKNIDLSENLKNATILISVIPTEKEMVALSYVKRNLGELRKELIKKLKINPVPFLNVQIDKGEKNRQKIDELLTKR